MSRYRCRKCPVGFRTNVTMEMIHHSITEHDGKYTAEYILKVSCKDRALKNKVLRLVGWISGF